MTDSFPDTIHILHVDDNPDFSHLVRTGLGRESDGFVVESETSARAALDRVEENTVDCIVADYDMPEQTGIEFLETVRDRYPDLPFILFTGKTSEQIASEAISAGVTDYLHKQGGMEQFAVLANRVRNAVGRMRADRERKQRLEAIETAQEGISILDADGYYRFVNDAYADIYGYDPSDLVGKHKDVVYPEGTSFTEDVLPDVREQGRIHGEGALRRADGGTVQVQYTVATTETEALICTAKDVTHRRERERKLAALNSIADEITTSESVAEICERTVEASEEILNFDLSVVDIETDGYLEKRAISDRTPVADTTAMSVDEGIAGKTYRTGKSMLIADIEECDEARPQGPYRSALSVPIGDHGVFQAVSEAPDSFDESDLELAELLVAHAEQGLDRLESERERDRGRERLRAVFEAIPEPVVHVTFDGERPIVQTVNSAFEDVFGHPGDEVRGQSLNDVIVPEDRQDEATDIDAETMNSTIVEREVERVAADGRREFLFRAGVLDNDERRHEGIGIYIDITERRQRERAIERQNERLEEFADVVSHDLRNPLHVAKGRLELAREECASDHLDVVVGAHDRMEALIDQLLTMARDGHEIDDRESLDLATMAENCWHNVDTGDATLTVDGDRKIRADRSRFQQLLENLLGNAIEHAGPDVSVRIGTIDGGFYVEDDGPGIPADDREAVFERGYSTSTEGTGFGLRIVEQVVDGHGWTIDVSTSETGGARFEISGME
jgi:PAS domain S-box-containing protein